MTLRILVTGGAGFIGSTLLHHLAAETDVEVLCMDKLTYTSQRESPAGLLDAAPGQAKALLAGRRVSGGPDSIETSLYSASAPENPGKAGDVRLERNA